jgi:hypothetical protein
MTTQPDTPRRSLLEEFAAQLRRQGWWLVAQAAVVVAAIAWAGLR